MLRTINRSTCALQFTIQKLDTLALTLGHRQRFDPPRVSINAPPATMTLITCACPQPFVRHIVARNAGLSRCHDHVLPSKSSYLGQRIAIANSGESYLRTVLLDRREVMTERQELTCGIFGLQPQLLCLGIKLLWVWPAQLVDRSAISDMSFMCMECIKHHDILVHLISGDSRLCIWGWCT